METTASAIVDTLTDQARYECDPNTSRGVDADRLVQPRRTKWPEIEAVEHEQTFVWRLEA